MPSPFLLKPKTLFLIDGIGATLTALFLFVVLRTFYLYFGISPNVLLYLSLIALVFALYSFTCFRHMPNHWQPYLKAIAFANLLYCLLTAGLITYYYHQLTILGLAYFCAEILVICALAFVELYTAFFGSK
ncbi:MAG TPA: hypothetical protein PK239_15125 [Chitinophagales bacterium]|nr:hypothetical protein [Chitinophagales bacterium]HRK28603.1 hypothetical protein [Chitinophagales bacterium]